jgi:hypothetical protein
MNQTIPPTIRTLFADLIATVALWGVDIAVTIPQPARFAIHKLAPAQRRGASDRIKRAKDVHQAQVLIEALRARDPFALEDALEDARAQGKAGWSGASTGRSRSWQRGGKRDRAVQDALANR